MASLSIFTMQYGSLLPVLEGNGTAPSAPPVPRLQARGEPGFTALTPASCWQPKAASLPDRKANNKQIPPFPQSECLQPSLAHTRSHNSLLQPRDGPRAQTSLGTPCGDAGRGQRVSRPPQGVCGHHDALSPHPPQGVTESPILRAAAKKSPLYSRAEFLRKGVTHLQARMGPEAEEPSGPVC